MDGSPMVSLVAKNESALSQCMEYSRLAVLALQHCDVTPFIGTKRIILQSADVREAIRRGIPTQDIAAVVWIIAPHLAPLIPYEEPVRIGDVIIEA